MSINPDASSRKAGFTLWEVMLALTLMAILTGGMFTLMQTSLEAAHELQIQERHSQSFTGFIELLRRTLRNLPATASIEGGMFQETAGVYRPKVIFREAPQAFSWGENSLFLGETILSSQPQLGGLFTLGLYRATDTENRFQTDNPEARQRWLPLLKDLRKIQWRFYDARAGLWQEEWRDLNARPALLELNLLLPGESTISRTVFWLPPLARSNQNQGDGNQGGGQNQNRGRENQGNENRNSGGNN